VSHLHQRTAAAKLQLDGILRPFVLVARFNEVVDVLVAQGKQKGKVF
jgi:hypothetical protein